MKFRVFSWVALFIASFSCLMAEEYGEGRRIFTLLPTLDTPLAVEPSIPNDFVALSKSGILEDAFEAHDWVYWGPKDVLEAYFKNPGSLKQSILRVRLSETVKQVSPSNFSAENDDLCKLMAPMGLKRLFDVRSKWGKYPIYTITAEFEKKWLYAAWVGLSDAQGTTLLFELVYPGTKPTEKDFELWDLFIDKTKILPEPMYSDGFKLNYTQGATEVQLYGAKFSILAEQRYSDKLLQVVVDLQKSGFTGALDMVTFARLGPDPSSNGFSGGSGVKVYLSLTSPSKAVYTHMIPVLVKPVDDFAVKASDAQARGDLVYEQQLPCLLKEYLK